MGERAKLLLALAVTALLLVVVAPAVGVDDPDDVAGWAGFLGVSACMAGALWVVVRLADRRDSRRRS